MLKNQISGTAIIHDTARTTGAMLPCVLAGTVIIGATLAGLHKRAMVHNEFAQTCISAGVTDTARARQIADEKYADYVEIMANSPLKISTIAVGEGEKFIKPDVYARLVVKRDIKKICECNEK